MRAETIPEVISEQANMAIAATLGAVGTITVGELGGVDDFPPMPVVGCFDGVCWPLALGTEALNSPLTRPAGNHSATSPRRICICGVSFPLSAKAFNCAPVKGPRSPFATRTNHWCLLLIEALSERIAILWREHPCSERGRIRRETASVQFPA